MPIDPNAIKWDDAPPGAMTHDGLPAVRNSDGSYSTELSITVTDPRLNGGRPTNIPSLWGGRVLPEGDAVQAALKSGKPFVAYPSIDEAVTAAKARSQAGGAGVPPAITWDTPSQAKVPKGNASEGGRWGGVKQGLRDPIDAGAQLLTHILPESWVRAGNRLNNKLADMGLPLGRLEGPDDTTLSGLVTGQQGTAAAPLDRMIKGQNAQYEADRAAAGRDGFDGARLFGNVANPVNLIPAGAAVKGAQTVGQIALAGAKAGALGGLFHPVLNSDTENFWAAKALQAGTGAASGAVLTPILAKGAEAVAGGVRAVTNRMRPAGMVIDGQTINAVTPEQLDVAVNRILQSQGMSMQDAPRALLDSVRTQVQSAVQQRGRLDPAAAMRIARAEALGMTGESALTMGQATRNPMQWAREQNLSGLNIEGPEGAGNPLATRFQRQNQALQAALPEGAGADPVLTGQSVLQTAGAANRTADENIRAAYTAFREATGRDLEVPLQGLAQDYATTLRDFGEVIPAAVRSRFDQLGLMGGTQRTTFSLADAEDLIKTINRHYDPAKRAEATALNDLRRSLQNAVGDAVDTAATGDGAQAAQLAQEARGVASSVYRTREQAPILQAAANNEAPDRVLQQYLVSAPVREVVASRPYLEQNPQVWQQVREHFADILRRNAFGENLSGDRVFSPERFARGLRALGQERLSAIFTPEEVMRLNLAAQVASDLHTIPAGAQRAVNLSNTGSAVGNLLMMLSNSPLRNVPGGRALADQARQIANERAVQQAAAASPSAATTAPQPGANLSPEQVRALRLLFAPPAVGAGAAAGSNF